MNRVVLLGRVSTEIELRTANNLSIAKFRLAVDRRNKEGEADFIPVTAFGKTAEILSKYSAKGKRLGVEGRIQTGSYTKQDGSKVYTTDVIADSVEVIEFKDAPQIQTPTQMSMEGFMKVPDTDDGLPFGR